jgi:GDP-4-dehydro-6-deoxy-D-mannose reductase
VRCFITGIGGFVGLHLADALLAAGHEVSGTVTRDAARPELRALAARHAGFAPDRLVVADVTDRAAVERGLAATMPQRVFHLAAIAFAPRAEVDPARTLAVNVLGAVHVIDAAHVVVPDARVVIAGSAEAYGAITPADLPIDEATPLRPVSLYGVSKAAADLAAFERWWMHECPVIRVRAFNHTGPGQSADFVCSDFARQIARIEAGLAPPVLRVGNLEAARDFSDVRDVVRGYALLAEHGAAGQVYNLCSGVATSVARIVEILTSESTVAIHCEQEMGRLRAHEVPTVIGSAVRAAALGWRPDIALRQTLHDLLYDWRERVAADPEA